eukprot:TRINITY_DN3559_c0_g1_i1.p1 TRINITY_DN3559_c0_g1~~TRINITY_DN3559_c0_g1_i1.p1  ORF type:complete len:118 (+),score=23.93 TRINITY_DN3559_c0_g1_i1:54-356(+)
MTTRSFAQQLVGGTIKKQTIPLKSFTPPPPRPVRLEALPLERVVKVTLVRSLSGKTPIVRKNIQALGLRRINQSVYHMNLQSVRGQINRVKEWVDVEAIQ